MSLKRDAEILRYRLIAGDASVADAVEWADGVIAAEAHPDPCLVDISMAGHQRVHEVVRLLRAVPGETSSTQVMRMWLGHMLEWMRADPSQAVAIADWLYRLACEGELPDAEFGWEPFALPDQFHLADMGACSEEDAIDGVRRYLERHARPLSE